MFKANLKLIRGIFLFFIVLITALPSGQFFNFPIKIFAFVFLALTLWFTVLHFSISFHINEIVFILTWTLFLLFYTLLGLTDYGVIGLNESKFILITFTLTTIVLIFHLKIFRDSKVFLDIFTYSILLIFSIKFISYVFGFLSSDSLLAIVDFYEKIFGLKIVTLGLSEDLFRVYLQTDMIAAILPFVVAWYDRKIEVYNKALVNIVLVMAAIIVLTSFSRYLFMVYATGLFFLLYYRKFLVKFVFFMIPFLFLLMIYFFQDLLLDLIELRFNSPQNDQSDGIRIEQENALINLFMNGNIFWGQGFGAFNPHYIRSETNPFSYERQWLSFLPKIGLFGILFIVIMYLYLNYKYYLEKNLVCSVAMILFLVSGLFNPYLYSSNVVLLYSFLIATSHKHKDFK